MTTPTMTQLTEEDQATWRSYLVAARMLFAEIDRSLDEASGLSLPDYTLLYRLRDAGEDGLRMSELADSAVFSRSRISHAISRLERQGWVERRSCPTDRRGSFAVLSEKGRAKLEEAEPVHTRVVRDHLLDVISPGDQAAFRRVTDGIGVALGARPEDPECG